jgi:hypothetical protein
MGRCNRRRDNAGGVRAVRTLAGWARHALPTLCGRILVFDNATGRVFDPGTGCRDRAPTRGARRPDFAGTARDLATISKSFAGAQR